MQSIAVIADDLTGAADTGVQFYPYFDRTVLISYLQLSRKMAAASRSLSQATALYTDSRALNADAAGRRLIEVARRISQSGSTWLYKKVDSCLRGNLGAEVEALMDELDYEVSFIAPAFPEMGRTTLSDIHLVYGTPVARTEIVRDPVTPVTDSCLSRVVKDQSRYPVGHVDLTVLEGTETGLQAEIERLIRDGVKHIVFDATEQAHLDRIARLVFSTSRRILPVGSAGLAGSMGGLLPSGPSLKKHAQKPVQKGTHLLVCGSISEVTRRQIKTLSAVYPYEEIALDPEALADSTQIDTLINTAPGIGSRLAVNNLIIKIDAPQKIDRIAAGPAGRRQVVASIVKNMGRFVALVLTGFKPGLLFITGGDTAAVVLTAVKAEGIQVHGEIVPGVVRGALLEGPLDGLPVVTKAGAFGHDDTLVVLHESWQKISDT